MRRARRRCAPWTPTASTSTSSTAPIRRSRTPSRSATFKELQDEGKVRWVGISNVTVDQLEEALGIVDVVSVQNELSLGYTRPIAKGEVQACTERGIAFLAWSPLGGISAAAEAAGGVDPVRSAGEAHGVSPQQVALAWLLSLSPTMIPIPGSSRPETITDSLRAAELELQRRGQAPGHLGGGRRRLTGAPHLARDHQQEREDGERGEDEHEVERAAAGAAGRRAAHRQLRPLGLVLRAAALARRARVMLGQDAAAARRGRAGRRYRGAGARRRGHHRRGRARGLAAARAVQRLEPAQPAALERDHACALEVGDACDLAAGVGAQAPDAGAQAEHATLRAGHARQAAAEAKDGAPQGVLAALHARGAARGLGLRGAGARALAVGAGRAGCCEVAPVPGVEPVAPPRVPVAAPLEVPLAAERDVAGVVEPPPARVVELLGVRTDGVEAEGIVPAGVLTDGVLTDGTETDGTEGAGLGVGSAGGCGSAGGLGTGTGTATGAGGVGSGGSFGGVGSGGVGTDGAGTGGVGTGAGSCAPAGSPVIPIETTKATATNHHRRRIVPASPGSGVTTVPGGGPNVVIRAPFGAGVLPLSRSRREKPARRDPAGSRRGRAAARR